MERESVDHYQAVLADLRARRARIDMLIAGIEAASMGNLEAAPALDLDATATSAPPVPVVIHPDTFFGLTILDAIKKLLRMAKRAQHVKAIADALEQGGLRRPSDNVLSGILARAAKGRDICKVGKGMWGLSEWYPKAPRETREPVPERRKKRPQPIRRASAARRETVKLVGTEEKRVASNGHAPRGSMSAVLLEVLREAGKPLHVKYITNAMNMRGADATRASVEGQLNRWAKMGRVKKPEAGTFAL